MTKPRRELYILGREVSLYNSWRVRLAQKLYNAKKNKVQYHNLHKKSVRFEKHIRSVERLSTENVILMNPSQKYHDIFLPVSQY